MNFLRLYINRRHSMIALGIVLLSVLLKCFFIFHFTSFRNSLVMDMGSYWYDSFQRAWGDRFSVHQWGNFPPFYKFYILAPLFRGLSSIGCISFALNTVILMNIVFYGISAYVFYLLIDRLIVNKAIALTALIFYAFSYLAAYLNALVLPDSLAVSGTVTAAGITVLSAGVVPCLAAGFLLGIAIGAKPLLISFSPVFIAFVFFGSHCRSSFWKAVIFALAVMTVPMMTVIENAHVSKGEIKSLGALGGLNFYQGWAKVKRVCRTDACFGSPGAIDEPHWKSVTVTQNWYDQGYFYHSGVNAIAGDRVVLLEKIFWFKKLFWGMLGPPLSTEPEGYDRIMPVVRAVSYGMFLSLGLLFFTGGKRPGDKSGLFLFGLLAAFLVFIYIFGMPERRYFLSIEFLVTALFFVMISRVAALCVIYRKEMWMCGFLALSVLTCVLAERKLHGVLY